MGKFEIYKDQVGQYRFRLRAPNGEIIATGEGYTTKQGCLDGINAVKKYAPIAPVVDLTILPFGR
jgi:hypothetical protein